MTRLAAISTALSAVLATAVLVPPAQATPRVVGSPHNDCRSSVAGLDLETATISDLQAALSSGRLSSHQLVVAYLARIKAYNGPLDAIRDLSPTAIKLASQSDARRRAGRSLGPLEGIPILLKDNIDTSDQPTTAGSIALEGLRPYKDATLTAKLRAAGAIILGKTNLSEFANWVDLSMPNGYSSLGGQVVNAYNGGDPLGSSSGSGVGGSMAFAAATFGSETSGSILAPSSVNGLVGVKPTRGLISRSGVIPLAEGFDTAGPIARNVSDAAALLTAVAGTDKTDAASADADKHKTNYSLAIAHASLKGVRLGYSTSEEQSITSDQRRVFDQALADLRRLGAVIVPTTGFDTVTDVSLAELGLIPNDFKANLDHYLQTEAPTPKSGVKSLVDIVLFNRQHTDKVKYGQNLLIASAAQPGSAPVASLGSLALRTVQAANIDRALQKDALAAVLAPGYDYAGIGASAGYPTVVVPAGMVGNTPLGLSFMGTAWSEAKLLTFGAAYEKGTHRRIPPTDINDKLVTGC